MEHDGIKVDVGVTTVVKGDIMQRAIMLDRSVGSFDFDTRNSKLAISILLFVVDDDGTTVVAIAQQHSLYKAIIRGSSVLMIPLDVITSDMAQKKEILESTFFPAPDVDVAFAADSDAITLLFVFPAEIIFCIQAGILFLFVPLLLLQ